MSVTRADVEAILVLSTMLPNKTADELLKLLEDFYGSEFDKPYIDLYSCLSRYVGYLAYTGQVDL